MKSEIELRGPSHHNKLEKIDDLNKLPFSYYLKTYIYYSTIFYHSTIFLNRKNRVPQEPDIQEDHIVMSIRHPD